MIFLWLPCNLFLMAELTAQPSHSEKSNPLGGLFPNHPLMFLKLTGTEHPGFCPNITCWMAEFSSQFKSHWGNRHPSHCTRCAERPLSDAKCIYISILVGFESVLLINPPYCALAGTVEWPGLLQLHPFLLDACKAEEMCHECTYCAPAANSARKSQTKSAPQSQGSVDANPVVFDRASPCRLLANTHHLHQHNAGAGVVWHNNHEHRSAVTIFTVSDQTMLQFIHKLLMFSNKPLALLLSCSF